MLDRQGGELGEGENAAGKGLGPSETGSSAGSARLEELMDEFGHRQRRRPDLVVRPWWTTSDDDAPGSRGFVVEYCPTGRESAELRVRDGRVTVEGPAGATETELDLEAGWLLGGLDTRSPQTLANHLLRLADAVLGEAA